MDRQRIWILGSVMAIVAVGALGWFLGISPALDAASATDKEATSVEQQNGVLQIKTAALSKQMDKLPDYQTELAALQAGVPEKPDQEVLYRELAGYAAQYGVTIATLTMVEPTQLVTAADISPSLVTPQNFQTISIDLELNGTYPAVSAFVDAVQKGSRLVVFNSFGVTALDGSGADAFNGSTVLTAKMSGLAFAFGESVVPPTQGGAAAPATGGTTASGK